MLTTIYYEREGDIIMKKESQDGKSKRPATPHGAGYLFYHSGKLWGLTSDFSTLDVPKVLGYGGLALGGFS